MQKPLRLLLPGAALLFATLLYHTIGNGGLDTFALRNPTDRTVYFVTMLLAGAPTASTAGAAGELVAAAPGSGGRGAGRRLSAADARRAARRDADGDGFVGRLET